MYVKFEKINSFIHSFNPWSYFKVEDIIPHELHGLNCSIMIYYIDNYHCYVMFLLDSTNFGSTI